MSECNTQCVGAISTASVIGRGRSGKFSKTHQWPSLSTDRVVVQNHADVFCGSAKPSTWVVFEAEIHCSQGKSYS